ncbi:anti-sigma factor [Bacillus carboniphilus]|uniref:Anti-sigma-W factor RsiW n=1 Tax=Bacillus carboniphilus TaxID=86663 RepID=A0ABY9JT77_9BACI|nr:anti-sigma factor [Bacillus carboniphilus]WLR42029.1 anti-sigma factor [Bacillus carboniphilus]
MKCSKQVVEQIHEYLDGDLTVEQELTLKEHLYKCEECLKYLHELDKSIALVKSTSHVKAPDDFTNKVMQRLPDEKKTIGMQRWMKNHPFLIAASLFMLLMTGSVLSSYQDDQQFQVSHYPNLKVEDELVIVPEGEVIEGDITVKNGNIQIDGKVEGDVTVINGEQYMASAGQVTGEIDEINQVFSWIWFHIKSTVEQLFNR